MITWKQSVDVVLSRGLWRGMRPIVARRILKRAYLALGRMLLSILARCGIGQRESEPIYLNLYPHIPGNQVETCRIRNDQVERGWRPADWPGEDTEPLDN